MTPDFEREFHAAGAEARRTRRVLVALRSLLVTLVLTVVYGAVVTGGRIVP